MTLQEAMKKERRLLFAVAIAPLASGPVGWLFSLPTVGISELPWFMAGYSPFAYLAALFGGIPLHLLLRTLHLRSPLIYSILGGGLAVLTGWSVAPWGDASDYMKVFFPGVASGLVFWSIAVSSESQSEQAV